MRPDIIARVFKMKLDAMITGFTKNSLLGRVLAGLFPPVHLVMHNVQCMVTSLTYLFTYMPLPMLQLQSCHNHNRYKRYVELYQIHNTLVP